MHNNQICSFTLATIVLQAWTIPVKYFVNYSWHQSCDSEMIYSLALCTPEADWLLPPREVVGLLHKTAALHVEHLISIVKSQETFNVRYAENACKGPKDKEKKFCLFFEHLLFSFSCFKKAFPALSILLLCSQIGTRKRPGESQKVKLTSSFSRK